MEFLAFYRDPKKRTLQRIQIGVMALLLPVALVWGVPTYTMWSNFRQAEQIFAQAEELVHSGRYAEAMPLFEQCTTLYPEFYGAWESLATVHHFTNNHQGELDTYLRAIAALPQSPELHRDLGAAYHEVGNHAKELEHLQLAQQLFGREEIFTYRLLDRAQREANGTYPDTPMSFGAQPTQEPLPTPAAPGVATPADSGHDHGHDHDHSHDHDHDHSH